MLLRIRFGSAVMALPLCLTMQGRLPREADGRPWHCARHRETRRADSQRDANNNPPPPRADHDVRNYPLAEATISRPPRLVTVSK